MEELLETPNPQKRQANKERNRQAILHAARLVFAEIGYEGASIRDIIRRTDLASGTFYNYFKTKDEVFLALHDDAICRFKPHLRDAFEQANGDFGKFIETAFARYFEFKKNETVISIRSEKILGGGLQSVSPESMAIFNEISGYLKSFLVGEKFCHINSDFLIAACIGLSQEIGLRLSCDKNYTSEAATQFATQFVLGGIQNMCNSKA